MRVSSSAYARELGVDKRLVELLSALGSLPVLEERGRIYQLERVALPTSASDLVTLGRDAYRDLLERTLGVVAKLESEVEAMRFDLQDALENGTDPVQPLGNNIRAAEHSRTNRGTSFDSVRTDLGWVLLELLQFNEVLLEHDRSARAIGRPPTSGTSGVDRPS